MRRFLRQASCRPGNGLVSRCFKWVASAFSRVSEFSVPGSSNSHRESCTRASEGFPLQLAVAYLKHRAIRTSCGPVICLGSAEPFDQGSSAFAPLIFWLESFFVAGDCPERCFTSGLVCTCQVTVVHLQSQPQTSPDSTRDSQWGSSTPL